MGFDFIVLGATGIQGRIVTRDLLENGYSVLMCGRDKSRILHLLKKFKKTYFKYIEARKISTIVNAIKNSKSNIVINCIEGNWNLNVLNACLKTGVHSVDLGSDIPMTKKQLAKDKVLKKKNLIHITGIGSVPGIGNIMLRHIVDKFDKIDGIDVGFAWDSNIKEFVVPFSIQSIIEEFTAPAPFIHHKKIVKIKPLNSIVKCYHRAIGKEKQFNVGHHPETYTFYSYCKNKGIENVRFFAGFPDHSFEKINSMIQLGFGSKKEINFKGKKTKPIEFLTEVMKRIKMPKGYTETENLWVEISGRKNNKKKKILMECIAPTLKGWEDAGCNIDTGMPASILAQMIKKGVINQSGSYSPEYIVSPEPFFKELRKREMVVLENGKRIN